MIKSLTLITGNPGKIENFRRFIKDPFNHQDLDLDEIQSPDLSVVLEHKAKSAYEILKSPVVVDDSSLQFGEYGALPGTFIKWFLKEKKLGTQGLCKMLDGFSDRSALVVIGLGLYDGEKFRFFEGRVPGTIASEPRGTKSFGFDSIFIPEGYTQTRAEMDKVDEEATNARLIALRKLEEFLQSKSSFSN